MPLCCCCHTCDSQYALFKNHNFLKKMHYICSSKKACHYAYPPVTHNITLSKDDSSTFKSLSFEPFEFEQALLCIHSPFDLNMFIYMFLHFHFEIFDIFLYYLHGAAGVSDCPQGDIILMLLYSCICESWQISIYKNTKNTGGKICQQQV